MFVVCCLLFVVRRSSLAVGCWLLGAFCFLLCLSCVCRALFAVCC